MPRAGWGLLIRSIGDSVSSLPFLFAREVGQDEGANTPPQG